jgi:hypothetical protein
MLVHAGAARQRSVLAEALLEAAVAVEDGTDEGLFGRRGLRRRLLREHGGGEEGEENEAGGDGP